MTAMPMPQLLTYAALEALPDEARAEILGGQLITEPAPLPRHARVARAIGRFIGGPYDDDEQPGGWWILPEVDIELELHEVVRPDIAGWHRARLPQPGAQRPIHVAPDWVCEVLSPSTARSDRLYKSRLYARHDVPHYWIIDPVERLLEVYALRNPGQGQWTLLGVYDETASERLEPFVDVELAVGRLFLPRDADPNPEGSPP